MKQLILAEFHHDLNNKDDLDMNNSVDQLIQDILNYITESTGKIEDINWKSWHIGLTVYPNQEKRDNGKPARWKSWKANSSADAIKIQQNFIDKYPINQNRISGQYDYFVYIFYK